MMQRRAFVAGMASVMVAPLAAKAQQPRKVYRIGFLSPGPASVIDHVIAALGKLGWRADRDIVVERRYTQGDPLRAEALARDLVGQRVDVIVTNFTTTAMAAHRATTVTPIVMASSGFPIERGLANSLARPGRNVTGMTIYAGGGPLFGKFVQLLADLVPSLKELGVLWAMRHPPIGKNRWLRRLTAFVAEQKRSM